MVSLKERMGGVYDDGYGMMLRHMVGSTVTRLHAGVVEKCFLAACNDD